MSKVRNTMAVFAEALSVARLGASEQPAYLAVYGG